MPRKKEENKRSAVNRVERLAALEFVRDHKDLFITGPTGTGKSYPATAPGNKACQDGFRVFYSSTNKLISLLKIAKAKGTILNDLKRIERADLLILDDLASPSSFAPKPLRAGLAWRSAWRRFGMRTLDSRGRGIMMEVIEDRHGKRSTMITSQVPVKGRHDVIGERTVADAILDRIVHHALRVELVGESIRKRKIKNENVFL